MAASEAVRVRSAEAGDLASLTDLYNHYVVETSITFDVEPVSLEARRAWLAGFADSGPHRLLVAEADDRLLGYASSQPFRKKAAYDSSVETSIYLHRNATGHGVGGRLYAALFEALEREPVHLALAGITLPNEPSLALHRRFGFEPVGVFREVGLKFGRYWDVAWYQRRLPGG